MIRQTRNSLPIMADTCQEKSEAPLRRKRLEWGTLHNARARPGSRVPERAEEPKPCSETNEKNEDRNTNEEERPMVPKKRYRVTSDHFIRAKAQDISSVQLGTHCQRYEHEHDRKRASSKALDHD
jgi:hypothetical protein